MPMSTVTYLRELLRQVAERERSCAATEASPDPEADQPKWWQRLLASWGARIRRRLK